MAFSEFKFLRLHFRSRLKRVWVLALLALPFAALGLLGLYVNGSAREVVEVVPGTLLRITRVPEHGWYGSAATPWYVEVEVSSGETVVAEFPLRPQLGERVCVVHSTAPFRGSVYEVTGYIEALEARGKACRRTKHAD